MRAGDTGFDAGFEIDEDDSVWDLLLGLKKHRAQLSVLSPRRLLSLEKEGSDLSAAGMCPVKDVDSTARELQRRIFKVGRWLNQARAIVRSQPPAMPVAVGGGSESDHVACLLYTSPSPRDQRGSRMPSSA